jgi:hypothetical protein
MTALLTVITLLAPLAVVAFAMCPFFAAVSERAREQIDLEWVLVCTLIVVALLGTFTSGWFISALWYRPNALPPLVALVWASLLGGWLVSMGQHFKRHSQMEKEWFEMRRAKEGAENALTCADMLEWHHAWFISDLDLVLLTMLDGKPEVLANLWEGWGYDKRNEVRFSLWKLQRAGLTELGPKISCRVPDEWTGHLEDSSERTETRDRSTIQTSVKGRETVARCFGKGRFSPSHARESIEAQVAERWANAASWRKYAGATK